MSGTSLKTVKARYQMADRVAIGKVMNAYLNGSRSFSDVEEVLGVTGLAAELVKKNEERKVMHQMLTDAGIPSESAGSGEGICLIGRLAIATERA